MEDESFSKVIGGLQSIPKKLAFIRKAFSIMSMDKLHLGNLRKNLGNLHRYFRPAWKTAKPCTDEASRMAASKVAANRALAIDAFPMNTGTVYFLFGKRPPIRIPGKTRAQDTISQPIANMAIFKKPISTALKLVSISHTETSNNLDWDLQQTFHLFAKGLCSAPDAFDPFEFVSGLNAVDPCLLCALVIFVRAAPKEISTTTSNHLWVSPDQEGHLEYNTSMESMKKLDVVMVFYMVLFRVATHGGHILSQYFNESLLRIVKGNGMNSHSSKTATAAWGNAGTKVVTDSLGSLVEALDHISEIRPGDFPLTYLLTLFNHSPYLVDVQSVVRCHNYRYVMQRTGTPVYSIPIMRRLAVLLTIMDTSSGQVKESFEEMARMCKGCLAVGVEKWAAILNEDPGHDLLRRCIIIETFGGDIRLFNIQRKKMEILIAKRKVVRAQMIQNGVSFVNGTPRTMVIDNTPNHVLTIAAGGNGQRVHRNPKGGAPKAAPAKVVFRTVQALAKRPSLPLEPINHTKHSTDVQTFASRGKSAFMVGLESDSDTSDEEDEDDEEEEDDEEDEEMPAKRRCLVGKGDYEYLLKFMVM
jgi:hypothetical protein